MPTLWCFLRRRDERGWRVATSTLLGIFLSSCLRRRRLFRATSSKCVLYSRLKFLRSSNLFYLPFTFGKSGHSGYIQVQLILSMYVLSIAEIVHCSSLIWGIKSANGSLLARYSIASFLHSCFSSAGAWGCVWSKHLFLTPKKAVTCPAMNQANRIGKPMCREFPHPDQT